MCKCCLCGPISHNDAEFSVSFGSQDRPLHVCHWCEKDLTLFGMRLNQVVRLAPSRRSRSIPVELVVLGPVYTVFTEAKT